jgi:hypothetical protein
VHDGPSTESPSDLVSEQLECASAWGEASECTGQVQYRYVRAEGGSTPYCDQHWAEEIALRREQHEAAVARRQADYQAKKAALAARTSGEQRRDAASGAGRFLLAFVLIVFGIPAFWVLADLLLFGTP